MNRTISSSKSRFSRSLRFLGLAAFSAMAALSGCACIAGSGSDPDDEELGEVKDDTESATSKDVGEDSAGGQEATSSAASALTVGMYDVGIIPCAPRACPAGSEYVEIHTDDEDHNNDSSTSGWTGAIGRDPSGTTFGFCRVNGLDFHLSGGAYAVLKLGSSCPPGSYEALRHFDNENSSTHNWTSGNYLPNLSSNNGDYWSGDTTLYFCTFAFPPVSYNIVNNNFPSSDFPNYVVPYGVFAANGGLATGHVHTDDEDGSDPLDPDMPSGNPHIEGQYDISAFVYSSNGQNRPNSELKIAQVRGGQCPTGLPTASSKINGASASPIQIYKNSPITLDGSASTFASSVFVSVMKSDVNWGSTGPESCRWLTPSDLNDYGPMSNFNVRGFFASFGQSFVPGQYYRVKLAVGSPWNETTKLVYINLLGQQVGDYDGDSKTDYTVRRPSQAKFYTIRTTNQVVGSVIFGDVGDIPVDGDYDGDGKTDYALWKPSTGVWDILKSSTNTHVFQQLGVSDDIPISGDYDGDGKTDFTVRRPSQSRFYTIRSSTGQIAGGIFGAASDIPISGDFDGDGKSDYALWNPSTGAWDILNSSTNSHVSQQWGTSGDIPISGDFDGDGKTDFTVRRPSQSKFYTIRSSTGQIASGIVFGSAADIPVNGDFDGDGKSDYALWNPSTGGWDVLKSSTGAHIFQQWGTNGDIPMPPLHQ